MARASSPWHLCASVALVGGLALAGCNRNENDPPNHVDSEPAAPGAAHAGQQPTTAATPAPEHGQDVTVTGCLTANVDGRSYALTPSDAQQTEAGRTLQTPGRDTITYELVGDADQLRPLANTVVTVRGKSDASANRDAEVERRGEQSQTPAQGAKDTPTVETKEQVDIEVRRLHVSNVVGTGTACSSMRGGTGTSTGVPGASGPGTGTAGPDAKSGSGPRPKG